MAPARLLLATTLLVIAATSDDVHAAKLMCTDAKFAAEYAAIQNKMSACQAATGIALVLPLPAKKKTTLCEKCTELAATAGARGFPKCNVIADGESIPLNQQFVRLFRPCVAAANATPSPAGGDDDDDTPAKPASPSPSGVDNNTPATTTTPMPAATPTPAKSSGSHGSGKADSASTTPQPSKTPKPRKTPKASKAPKHPGNATTVVASIDASHADDIDDDDTVDSAAVDSSSSAAASSSGTRTFAGGDITSSATNDTISKTTSAAASTTSTGMIVGIVAGIVAVALVSAVLLVLHRRKRLAESDKHGAAAAGVVFDCEPPPSSSAAVPFQFGPAASTTSAGGRHLPSLASSVDLSTSESPSTASSSLLAPARHPSLWEDHAIVAARIPRDKVLAITLVSRGGFGEVHQGIYNHQRVAIKTLLPARRQDADEINAFLAEIRLMAVLEHAHIVRFVGVAWDSLTDVCAVTEFMDGGDLRGLLVQFDHENRPRGFDRDKLKIAVHVAHALTYLHSLQPLVLHRDLKSKNILLDKELNAKLTDFGVSRERSDDTMTAGVGTSLWMAPEVMMGERYDEKSDIFSFGVVLSEIDTHQVPYAHVRLHGAGRQVSDNAVLQMMTQGRLRVQFTEAHAPMPEIVELGNACVALDPRNRPSAATVMWTLHRLLKSTYVVM